REIGVAADRNGALARMKAVKFGGVGRGQCDEFWKIDAALADAFGKKQRGAHFEARNAVRHLLERRVSAVLHLPFRIVVAVAGVIGRENAEHASREPLPDHLLVRLVARWGAAHVFRALETWPVEVVRGEEEVLRAGLAVDLEPARLG